MRKTLCREHSKPQADGWSMECHGCGSWVSEDGRWVRPVKVYG